MPADPNLGEEKGRGLTNMRSAGKADGNRVRKFRKVRLYQQSTKLIVQYHRAVPPGKITLPIVKTKDRPLMGEGLPTVGGGLSKPGEEGVKAGSTNP